MDNSNISVGCKSGKTILVDPNKFQNQEFYQNVSVPLEDLNIYVQLETTKRARTVLIDNGVKISNNTKGVAIKFIEGSDINGSKSLTTRYTDLTTNFEGYDDENYDNESLGITSIDIDFNSSNAPLVVINFVDLRGSSVFQNENMLKSGNKYSTLFQLPYPIFTLTVKGYYGLPVSYDLHMTKFNAKFNSKTGNFEITANFIGYTYAMLSDMLIGYLRAIEHTNLGKKKYEEIRQTRPNLLTLDELILAVSNIDKNLEKLAGTDETVIKYNIYNTQIEKIGYIENNILDLGSKLDILNDLPNYRFIRPKNISVEEYNKIVKPYNSDIKTEVENFNKGSDLIFDIEDFNFSKANLYQNISLDLLRDPNKREELRTNQLSGADDFENLIIELESYAVKNEITNSFNVYDLRSFYNKINTKEIELNNKIKEYKIQVGEKLRDKIRETLKAGDNKGLDPTVRNIVEIFTTSVEVFLSIIFQVSSQAQNNPIRSNELSKFVPKKELDYKTKVKTSESSPSGELTEIYYPWPEYRKQDEEYGLVEEYLGKASGINKFNIDELNFIDDLHKAFLKSSEVTDLANIIEEKNESSWVATNPLDTPLFISDYPYSRFNTADKNSVLNVLLTRAFVYMGLTNYKLKPEEIQKYADAEIKLLLLETDEKLKRVIYNISSNDIVSSEASINNVVTPITKLVGNNYVYNYMFESEGKSLALLPLNKPVNSAGSKNFEFNLSSSVDSTTGYSNNGGIFFTNYTTSSAYENVNYISYAGSIHDNLSFSSDKNLKINDGGNYLKIVFPNTYNNLAPKALQSGLGVTESVLSLESLSKPLNEFRELSLGVDVGFNQFGGQYGIQEFRYLNFNIEGLEKAPFRLMFFADGIEENYLQGVLTPIRGLKNDGVFKYTPYDLNPSRILTISDVNLLNESDEFAPIIVRIEDGGQIGQNRVYLSEQINTKSFGFAYPYISYVVNDHNIGLFASRLYYAQNSEEAKAFLFLHSFPWNGLTDTLLYGGIFHKNEIINTFANRAGFISTPYLWAAFIGGLIWRMNSANDPIIFHDGVNSFVPTLGINDFPNKNQYLCIGETGISPSNSMKFDNSGDYKVIDELIVQLPNQVKEEFLNIFINFVRNNEGNSPWQRLKAELEIFDGSETDLVENWNNLLAYNSGNIIPNSSGGYDLEPDAIYTMFNSSISNYNIVTTYNPIDPVFKYNFFTEIKDKSPASFLLLDLLTSELIISNFTYRIWDNEVLRNKENLSLEQSNVMVSSEDMKIFLDQVIVNLKSDNETNSNKINQKENEIFGTDNDTLIKQLLYRTCKNIYDKWIAGTESEDKLIFRGGSSSRNGIDFELAKHRAEVGGYLNTGPKLIDSFRFVNRSFKDIGDALYVNPKQVVDSLINNPNISFYDSVTNMLSTNKFNFIALPNYINYKDEESLKTMFKPMNGVDAFKSGSTGPAFVCVYAGQPSKHLDFKSSEYENDGIDFRCDKDNNLVPIDGKDFIIDEDSTPFENNVAVFAVNYSQQNQSIFKDITLDQTEFTETAESLQITNEIANKGAENRVTLGGQNMYDVYSVRSYSTEIEMLGNAMIQPMMYFQLNNIPMFHGAYLIIKVAHTIKPNHMSTSFKGVRIKNVETPLLNAADLYMPLLESIKLSDNSTVTTTSNTAATGRAYLPLIVTLTENGATNGNIDTGNIVTTKVSIPKGVKNSISDTNKLIKEASDSLNLMLTDWVEWMKNNGFSGNNGIYAHVNSAFRTYEQQVETKKINGSNAATPGTSKHGWGIAVDFQYFKKDGSIIKNYANGKPNVEEGYDLNQNQSLVWLLDNSYTYGWIIPESLRDDTGLEEFWHFEYHGKSAACILAKRPRIKGREIDTTKPYKSIVKNPLNKEGQEPIYTSCTVEPSPKKELDGTNPVNLAENKNVTLIQPSNADVQFYRDILTGLGAPITDENLKFLYAWRQAEGAKAAWNPFNTTKKSENTTNYNCNKNAPVKNYASRELGLRATVDTINSKYYPNILNGLRNNVGAYKLSTYIEDLKKWGTGYGVNEVLAGDKVKPPAIQTTAVKVETC